MQTRDYKDPEVLSKIEEILWELEENLKKRNLVKKLDFSLKGLEVLQRKLEEFQLKEEDACGLAPYKSDKITDGYRIIGPISGPLY